ncbi:acyl-CoA dehydrogenase [Azorhizobium oxalatiphilum]|uniref:Acyl-CoA dehydrogenase n=1 Tax=Azorhizobium oxalatiphilum TaxID=980631 RepID=A0A917BXY0_9HYPH|nr:acyl-CoA dehydrogenase family protein [Azorhizobium oxalatiphilum]GGF60885.1 acyl-CoA dehydrogenase [Azorhizobium oxalatiphilum]
MALVSSGPSPTPSAFGSPPDEDGQNQTPPFADFNLVGLDGPLRGALGGQGRVPPEIMAFGAEWGSQDRLCLGRVANENPPRLKTHDPRGRRLDLVEFHPAYHALMAASSASGLHSSTWNGERHRDRAARLFITSQVEAGHVCPLTMTHAAPAALAAAPALKAEWLPRITSRLYDGRFLPFWEKNSVTLGMGMTERQGGTDVRANTTLASPIGGEEYEITGHKWFFSAPMSDAFLVLAQAPGGLTCFLMPRFRPDGGVNALHLQRLKDKLGNRSNASSEVEFDRAFAWRVGPEGRGVATILEMVQLTRLDCAVSSAGLMRMALAQAMHHARHRMVFGKLLLEQPAMRAVLADLALESEAATAVTLRLAASFDGARSDPAEAARARLLTPAVKFAVCKAAPAYVYEAMESLGGNGYVEESALPRLYREAPVNAIWEGTGTVVALDLLRAASREPEAIRALVTDLAAEAGDLPGVAGTAQQILADLAHPQPEALARRAADRLALLAATAALAASAPSAVADAYAVTRLAAPRALFGTNDVAAAAEILMQRAFDAP